MISKCFFSSQFCLVPCYLSWVFSTLTKVIQKYVHKLVFKILVSYWNWQSLCILKSLDVIDYILPSFMCHLLKNPVISNFVSKGHVCTIWLQFLNKFDSMFWVISNEYYDVYINVCMKKVSDGLFCIIVNNIIPSYFWII